MSLPVSFVEIRVLAHATEDLGKVLKSLMNLVGEEIFSEVEFSREKLEGHYGNPITLVKAKIYSKSQARKILQNIFSRLNEADKDRLLDEVEDRVDENGNFHFRLDKQEAYLGRIKLGNIDSIHIQVRLTIPRKQREKMVNVFKKIILG